MDQAILADGITGSMGKSTNKPDVVTVEDRPVVARTRAADWHQVLGSIMTGVVISSSSNNERGDRMVGRRSTISVRRIIRELDVEIQTGRSRSGQQTCNERRCRCRGGHICVRRVVIV